MPTLHLIYGPQGAGKSTLARKLAASRQAIVFSIDDWMQTLFGADCPQPITMEWALARVARCEALIWPLCRQILAAGGEVALDLGLMRVADRERWRRLAAEAGYPLRDVFVDAERAERKQRVMRRNTEGGDTFSFTVSPAMFDAMDALFEAPSVEERLRLQADAEPERAHV
ncbi:ATP-binding protein [Chromobacterium alkanivorans]|uniref:AAA family ATPase n=1 Tax=Chromobacterium alkanivorans TaxID=1071719 RepID=UPI0019676D2A|nr:ATP-binding protein [Chromobacterium alkanivorans]MBN3002885.1 ATP-binding protein [Chromobacterium alkanivorans]